MCFQDGGKELDEPPSHPGLSAVVNIISESKKLSRTLSDVDMCMRDRMSFISTWSRILEIGQKKSDSSSALDKVQLEKDSWIHWTGLGLVWLHSSLFVMKYEAIS